MLAVVVESYKTKKLHVLSTLPNDAAIDEATELAKGVMVHNRYRQAFVYLCHGEHKTKVKTIKRSWAGGKVKVK